MVMSLPGIAFVIVHEDGREREHSVGDLKTLRGLMAEAAKLSASNTFCVGKGCRVAVFSFCQFINLAVRFCHMLVAGFNLVFHPLVRVHQCGFTRRGKGAGEDE